jgi:phage terminase large subunit-like protein
MAWAEANLQHGEGDKEGEPFRAPWHVERLIYRWFEYDPAARLYLHNKGLVGYPKGNVKTELEELLALEHLEGPSWTYGTPVVKVAGVDGDQAAELVRRAGMMIPDGSALADRLKADNGRIIQRKGSGRILATSAALGKNDGLLTSLQLNDEIHEWDGIGTTHGAKRHGILERATNKRRNARQLNTTTAGADLESLCGAMYRYGCQVAAGELIDPSFLMEWWEASEHWDLDDADQLRQAIIEANPMASVIDGFTERLVRSYREHKLRGKVDEFCRYHLNRWMPFAEGQWMDMVAWDAQARPGDGRVGPPPPDGTDIILNFDGSESGDSTGITGTTVSGEPYHFVVGCWERTEHDGPDWRVPVDEVEDALIVACTRRWNAIELAADPAYWRGSLDRLEQRGLPVVIFDQSPARMVPACERTIEGILRGQTTHSGDPRLRRHVANCRRRETENGTRIVKEHGRSKKVIDLAVCAVMGQARAMYHALGDPETPTPFLEFV